MKPILACLTLVAVATCFSRAQSTDESWNVETNVPPGVGFMPARPAPAWPTPVLATRS